MLFAAPSSILFLGVSCWGVGALDPCAGPRGRGFFAAVSREDVFCGRKRVGFEGRRGQGALASFELETGSGSRLEMGKMSGVTTPDERGVLDRVSGVGRALSAAPTPLPARGMSPDDSAIGRQPSLHTRSQRPNSAGHGALTSAVRCLSDGTDPSQKRR